MKRILSILFLILLVSGCQKSFKPSTSNHQLKKLTTKSELEDYLKSVDELHQSRYGKKRWLKGDQSEEGKIVVTGSRITAADISSVTNNQVQGVDEGDIVKVYENYLIILRNGKLYSIDIGNESGDFLQPIDSINAFHTGWVHDVWLDELLIDDGLILITGFNYEEDVTEIIRLKINEQGEFNYIDTHLINSEDYYSESNYSSRLIDHQLVTYFPGELIYSKDFEFKFPKIAQLPIDFKGSYEDLNWSDLIKIENIYHPSQTLLDPYLHTFLKCNIHEPILNCNALGLISNQNVERFVTPQYIYLSTSAWSSRLLFADSDFNEYETINDDDMVEYMDDYEGKLFRIDHKYFVVDQTNIDVVPLNQFSFHQLGDVLYILGENNEFKLVKVPSRHFDAQYETSAIDVVTLNKQDAWQFKNKFINDHLVLVHSEINDTESSLVETISLNSELKNQTTLGYIVERIEIVGKNIFTSGYNSLTDDEQYDRLYVGLLSPNDASVLNEGYINGIVEGESRSHAFNTRKLGSNRIIGFTSKPAVSEQYGNDYYYDEPSEVTFIGGRPYDLNLFGHVKRQVNDEESSCEVSCDDWYGNTRPFFIGDRIFALSGFELIEVKIENQNLYEIDRIEFNKYLQR